MRTVQKMFGLLGKLPADAVGVEIEVECNDIAALPPIEKHWRMTVDGSLRGESFEAVLRKPMSVNKVQEAVLEIATAAKAKGFRVYDTGRAGVHVHLNMRDHTMCDVIKLLVLYCIFEESLTEVCGAFRTGNLFCLRFSDAEDVLDAARNAVETNMWTNLNHDMYRYSAVNLRPLFSFGSIEFRAMRSTLDEPTLMSWIKVLSNLRRVAVEDFATPQDIIQTFSEEGPQFLYDKVTEGLLDFLPFDPEGMHAGMWRGQYLAFARDNWEEPNVPINVEELVDMDGVEIYDMGYDEVYEFVGKVLKDRYMTDTAEFMLLRSQYNFFKGEDLYDDENEEFVDILYSRLIDYRGLVIRNS